MGFDPAETLAGVDLSNKVILITGSTSGIGFATAQLLVQYGAKKVYLAARNPNKAAQCIKRIQDSLAKSSSSSSNESAKSGGEVLFHQLDLSDPKEAKSSAEAFMQREERLDVLINCAAVILDEFTLGANGMQNTMVINYFSPFVFTFTLLPLLKKTATEPNADARIVNVASDGHRLLPDGFHFKSKEDFNVYYGNSMMQSFKRYNISKLLMILWTRELQRPLTEEVTNIIVVALHPGTVYTETCVTTSERFTFPFSIILRVFAQITFRSVRDGAGTLIIAAVSPGIRAEAEKYKGGYLMPIGKLSNPSKQAQNGELARELWATTETLLKEWGI
ncbi:hypothetical protein ACEPAG_1665 [Sanghuangporus baumii]